MNIFENAYFGKPYKTRGDKKAIYHWYDNEHLHAHHLIIEDGNDVDCHDDGKNICNDYPTCRDIVSEWEETINEEEIEELALEYAPIGHWETDYGEVDYNEESREAFKAGIRTMKILCRKCYDRKNDTCKQISRVACTLYELGKNQGLNPIK